MNYIYNSDFSLRSLYVSQEKQNSGLFLKNIPGNEHTQSTVDCDWALCQTEPLSSFWLSLCYAWESRLGIREFKGFYYFSLWVDGIKWNAKSQRNKLILPIFATIIKSEGQAGIAKGEW